MSRNTAEQAHRSLSPIQRKACIVLACCALALIVTIVGVILFLGGFGGNGSYDPDAYPVDTSLSAVLGSSELQGTDYISSTVFVGDENAAALYNLGLIGLDQFAGKDGMKTGDLLREACVYFAEDANAYTIPQGLAKMKPRRVVVLLGANEVDGTLAADAFVLNYRQSVKAVTTAYSYCDVIVASIPPVAKEVSGAAEVQLRIDQFNQALAQMCEEEGWRFLNSAEVLKADSGYAEPSYFNAECWNKSGANEFLTYLRGHADTSGDRRPDTENIPRRAAKPAEKDDEPEPTPTPTPLIASYKVEDSSKGSLTGNGKSGVSSLEFEVQDGESVSVTAVPAEGYIFFKWSDGVTETTRYDIIRQDHSVTAMFHDARVSLSLDQGDATIEMGQSITINATVKLGEKEYSNSNVQWSVNDDLEGNSGSFTFTGTAAGTYVIKAGIEVNGNYQSQSIRITVNAPPTEIAISGASTIRAGETTSLTAQTRNGSGETTWSCDQKPDWTATGNNVQFTASSVGSYTIKATNNGQTATLTVTVTEAPTPTPAPPTPAPTGDGDGEN